MNSADQPDQNILVFTRLTNQGHIQIIRADGEDRVVLGVEDAIDVATTLLVTAMDVKRGRL